MSYSDDSLKKAAETKERLEQKIVKLEVELTHLQDTLAVVNSMLKTSNFTIFCSRRSFVSAAFFKLSSE